MLLVQYVVTIPTMLFQDKFYDSLWFLNLCCLPGSLLHVPLVLWLEARKEKQKSKLEIIKEVMDS